MNAKKITVITLLSVCLLATSYSHTVDKRTRSSKSTDCRRCGCQRPSAPAPLPLPAPQPEQEDVTKRCSCNRPSAPAPVPQPQPAPEPQEPQEPLKKLMKLYCKSMLEVLDDMEKCETDCKCGCQRPSAPAPVPQPAPQPQPAPESEEIKGLNCIRCGCNRPSAPAPVPQPQPAPEPQEPQEPLKKLMKLYCRVLLEKALTDMSNCESDCSRCGCQRPSAPAPVPQPQPVPQPEQQDVTKSCLRNKPTNVAQQEDPEPQEPQDALKRLRRLYCRVLLERALDDMERDNEDVMNMEKMDKRTSRPEGEPFIVGPDCCNLETILSSQERNFGQILNSLQNITNIVNIIEGCTCD